MSVYNSNDWQIPGKSFSVSPRKYRERRADLDERMGYLMDNHGLTGRDRQIALKLYDTFSENRMHYSNNVIIPEVKGMVRSQAGMLEKMLDRSLTQEERSELANPIIKYLDRTERGPGFIVVTGYDPDNPMHRRYKVNGEYREGLVGENILSGRLDDYMIELGQGDSAVFLERDGSLVGAHIKINDCDVNMICNDDGKINRQLGLAEGVGNRNYDSITASKMMNCVVGILTQTGGHIKFFYDGKVILSTIDEEDELVDLDKELDLCINC